MPITPVFGWQRDEDQKSKDCRLAYIRTYLKTQNSKWKQAKTRGFPVVVPHGSHL